MANICSEWGWQVTAWGQGQKLESCSSASPRTGCTGAWWAVAGNTPSGAHSRCAHLEQEQHQPDPPLAVTASTMPGRGWGPCCTRKPPRRGKAVQRSIQRPGQSGLRAGDWAHHQAKNMRQEWDRPAVGHLPSPSPMGHLSPTFPQPCLTAQAASPPVVLCFPTPVLSLMPPYSQRGSGRPFLPLCQAPALPQSQQAAAASLPCPHPLMSQEEVCANLALGLASWGRGTHRSFASLCET